MAWLREHEKYPNPNSNYLFLGERRMMTRQAINYKVEQIGKRAKFIFKVNPHLIRHLTRFYLTNKGNDTGNIQYYLGQQNITHTVRYT